MKNAINWFEIPAIDFDRARTFYSTLFNYSMPTNVRQGCNMAFFNAEQGVGGAVVQGEGNVPSAQGTIVYLNAGEDLSAVLQHVEKAGGRVLVPKTQITPEIGYVAIFLDTEGNRVALHSMK